MSKVKLLQQDLLLVASVDLIDNLVDGLDGRPLVILARSLIDELSNLTLVHFGFLVRFFRKFG